MKDEFVTIPEAAKEIGVCSETVRKWVELGVIKRREFPPTRKGGKAIVRISRSTIREFMQAEEK